MKLKKLQKYVKNSHSGILIVILLLIALAFIANFFMPHNTIVFIGEYIFSFDYLGHIQDIIGEYKEYGTLIDNTNCHNCPDFYHYSRWYSLFKIGYLSIGNILNLHPFIFLLLSMVTLQLLGLYVFSRVFFQKFFYIPFLTASFFFIFYPYKYHLLVETHDGTIFGGFLLLFSIVVFILKNITLLDSKRLIGLSLTSGFLFSLFFNINIAYFPFVIYTLLFTGIFFINNMLNNLKKSTIFITSLIFPTILINIPLLHSIISFGNTRHYEGYISFNYLDSFFAGVSIARVHPFLLYTIVFLLVLTFCINSLSIKWRIKLICLYLFFSILVLGANSPFNVFGWIFEHIPFMDAIRSTYRMFFFQLTIIFILIYYFLLWFINKKKPVFRWIYISVICLIFLIPIIHILYNLNYIRWLQLPNEYFKAQNYLNSLNGAKIYFPNEIPGLKSLANSYSWSNSPYKETIVIYKNPFTSLLPVRDIVMYEKFPHLSPSMLELRTLTDMNRSTRDIVEALRLRNINYIIYDDNYIWPTDNQYQFSKKELFKNTKIKKKIGNIYILEVPRAKERCTPSYGDFRVENCIDKEPKLLINRTQKEYLLETSTQKYDSAFILNKNVHYYRNIINPAIHTILLQNNILFSHQVLQVEGNQKNIFLSSPLEKDDYQIYIPLLQLNDVHKYLKDAKISLRLGDKQIKTISTKSQCSGVNWIQIPLSVVKKEAVALDVLGEGHVILSGQPIILNKEEEDMLSEMAKKIKAIQMHDTYTWSINNIEETYPRDCNSIEIDLLNPTLQRDLDSKIERKGDTSITTGEQVLIYEIESSKNIHDIEVVSDVYYLGADKSIQIQLLQDGTEIYKSNKSTKDLSPNIFRIPTEYFNGKSYTLKVILSASGISLKNLYMRAHIVE